jgi:hypothetical protein
MRALLLAVLSASLALPQVPHPEPGSLSVEGAVIDQLSGAPLAGARIVLSAIGPDRTLTYSDATGHFRFDGLQRGPHNLAVSRNGYLQASQLVDISSGQNPAHVRISLTPQAVIAGSVEDLDGFPVASASIIVLTRSPQGGLVSGSHGGISSDDRGRFRAAGLAHGSYYLHVEPGLAKNWDARYTDVYYPSALKFEDAEPIEVEAGRQLDGIAVRLRISAGVRVQGRVALPPGFAVLQNGARAQVMMATVGIPGFGRSTWVPLADDGSFTLNNVQPGKYRLEPSLPPPYSRGFTTGPAGVAEPNLQVGTTDISGIVLHVEDTMPLDLAGTLLFDAATKPCPVIVQLMQNRAVQGQTASLDDGSFALRNIPPGKYRLHATCIGGRARGVSARLGDADLPYGELELKGPNPGTLAISMSSVTVRVEGLIVDSAGQPAPGKYALFQAVKPGLDPVAMATAEASGHFAAALRPGEYRVWPAAELPASFWDGKDAPHGQLVTIVQGENPPLRLVIPAVPK